jgi:GNAT superfamily N-acetyltransferase
MKIVREGKKHARDWFRLSARISGQQVGYVGVTRYVVSDARQEALAHPAMQISRIFVEPEYRKRGVATRLYEAAAKLSCKKYNLPLASDETRSPEADSFWRKQAAKGRARAVPETEDTGDYYILSCPAPPSLAGRRRR